MKFPLYKQLDSNDCGATCLRMVAKYYGVSYNSTTLRYKTDTDSSGVSLLGIKNAAEEIGFSARSYKADWEALCNEINLPAIIHWNKNHFVVLYRIKKENVFIADPIGARFKYKKEDFIKYWYTSHDELSGIVMELIPKKKFFSFKDEKVKKFYYLRQILPFKNGIFQFILATIIGSVISLIFPFLTQAVVDIGIKEQNLHIITLLMISQFFLAIGQLCNGAIQGLLMSHISLRINLSFVSNFINKIMRLPIAFFDSKKIGDIIQRIDDNSRIRDFLTNSLIGIVIAFVTFITYSIVMAGYNCIILIIFFSGSLLYIWWVLIFLKKRKELDKRRFARMSVNQGNTIQLLTGMQEIKLNSCEKEKLWEWEKIQTKLYKVNINTAKLEQIQSVGGTLINQIKNILISFVSAKLVVSGEISLGIMMAMQYIIGQLNTPIWQFIGFVQSAQNAKISAERLAEIYDLQDEECDTQSKEDEIPMGNIEFKNICFSYGKDDSVSALNNISFTIYAGKINAIVGASGSGKSTILKLLLCFYRPSSGCITINGKSLLEYSISKWRNKCGVIMQDGYLFSDTIAKNISLKDENPQKERLDYATKIANIQDYIESLPLGYQTLIGMDGKGLSAGQKQRILIARAIYKDPYYLIMDEATNALDTSNESIIMNNLEQFYKNRTVIIIAHRLSTIRNADNIIVIDKGSIAEQGKHKDLITNKGIYYNFVKNQIQ